MRAVLAEESTAVAPKTSAGWSARVRMVASLLIAVHVTAVFVAPWSWPPPTSEMAMQSARFLRPYLNAMFLSHGYRFFAPNPGPSHLIKYEVEQNSGSTVTGTLPDVNVHWPRLYYHRHFMISEFVFGEVSDTLGEVDEEAMSEQEREMLGRRRERAQALGRSIANSLMERLDGRRVRLLLVEHAIPPPWDVQGGLALTDASLYEERELGVFEKIVPADQTGLN